MDHVSDRRRSMTMQWLLGVVACGCATALGTAPAAAGEPVIDTTAEAVQTFYQTGVPHTDRQGNLRFTYDAAQSFLPIGLYHVIPCEVTETITFDAFTGTPDPNLGQWNGDYHVTVNLGATLDTSPLAMLQSVIVPGPGTGTLTATVQHLPASTVLTYAVGLSGTFQVVEQGSFTSGACAAGAVAEPAAELAAAGFNTAIAFAHNSQNPPAVLLEQGDAANMAVVIDSPLVGSLDPAFFGIVPAFAVPWFDAYKNDSRAFGFYITDEPLVQAVLNNHDIQEVYDMVLNTYNAYRFQTNHALLFAEFYPPLNQEAESRWNQFVTIADVGTHDNYLKFIGQSLLTMRPVAESMRRQTNAIAALGPAKPSWIVPQTFHYLDPTPGGFEGWDFLTPTELRAYLYTAMIHGATGVFSFAWDSHIMRNTNQIGIHPATPSTQYLGTGRVASFSERQQSTDLWRSLDAREASRGVVYGLNAQLATLTPIILSPTSDHPYEIWVDQNPISSAPIRTMLKESQGSLYLLAVNLDNLPIQARVEFPFLITSAPVLFENRQASVSGSTLEDTFFPYAAHVYEIIRSPTLRGDANCDGAVNVFDAQVVLQYGAGLGTINQLTVCADAAEFFFTADVGPVAGGDGLVNALDALLILQYEAGILTSLETLGLAAGQQDTDGDFMTDQQEGSYACLNASVNDTLQDPDGDGETNAAELVSGTGPCVSDLVQVFGTTRCRPLFETSSGAPMGGASVTITAHGGSPQVCATTSGADGTYTCWVPPRVPPPGGDPWAYIVSADHPNCQGSGTRSTTIQEIKVGSSPVQVDVTMTSGYLGTLFGCW